MDVEEQARQQIQQAEAAKITPYEISGKLANKCNADNPLLHSVVVDEDYAILGAHLDESVRRKIIVGEYVDFAKLIPKDRVSLENDKRLEIVSKNGQTFFQPIIEREGIGINNIYSWDQAFRVYCTIFTEVHAHRAPEMLQ